MTTNGRSWLWTATAVLLIVALALPWAVLADNLEPDQDYLDPGNTPLKLGQICAGKTGSGTAKLAIKRTGQAFNNGSTVTVSVESADAGVTAVMTDAYVNLPNDWESAANGTLSTDTAWSEVTVNTTGFALGDHTVQVKYKASGPSGTKTQEAVANLNVTFTVVSCQGNQPPTVDAGGPYSGNEGSAISLDGTASDPDNDSLTYEWTYEVVSADTGAACVFADDTAVDTTITCNDNGSFTLKLTVSDGQGHEVSDTADLTVANVAPDITELTVDPDSIDENDSTTLSGSFTDPGTNDTFTVSIDWGEGDPETVTAGDCGDDDATTWCFSAKHQYLDDNPTGTPSDQYTIKVAVADDDDGKDSADATLTVNNVAPSVTIKSPADGSVFAVNTPIDFVVEFTDPGTQDTWTCALSSEAGTFDPACTSPFTFEDVTFSAAGIYNVKVTVTDDDTGQGSATIMVVIYDPSAGFVTGGGWIYSPKGAYIANDQLEGKATFGFVSKYLKGAKVPTGNTEFQFHAAGFNFKSTAYEWLVISGSQAQYKGSGTVNGAGDYGFLLTAGDGAPDTFRLKVWDKVSGDIVYDNGTNQAIASGSIIIHTDKK